MSWKDARDTAEVAKNVGVSMSRIRQLLRDNEIPRKYYTKKSSGNIFDKKVIEYLKIKLNKSA